MLLLCMVVGLNAWAVEKTAILTGSSLVKSGTPSTSYADYAEGVTDSQNYEWTGRWCYQKSGSNYYQMVQIKAPESSVTSRLNVPTYQGKIKSIEVITTNTSATVSNGTKASGTLYVTKAWAKADYAKEENIVSSGSLSDGTITFDLSEGTYTGDGLYIVSSAATRIWSVKVVYEETEKVNVSNVSINQSSLSLLKGAQATLTATVTPSNATIKKIIWSSDKESVATVANGVVTAVSEGTATITAKSDDNQTISASCLVTVTAPAKTGNVYEKVTSNQTDWTGKYLIVYEPTAGTGYAFNASLATLDNLNNYKEISTSNSIEGDVLIDQYAFEVEKNGEGYSIKSQTDLYIGLGSYNNGLSTNAKQTQYANKFSYNTKNECTEVMLDFGSDGKCYLQFNDASNQMRFRYYKAGSQKNIQLYKLEEEAPTSYSLPISSVSYSTFYDSKNAYVMPEDCEGYVFTVENGLKAVYEGGDVVPAGEPLVIYTIKPGTKELVYTTSTEETYKSGDMNDLEGTDEQTALEADDASYFYALSLDKNGENVGFYWMNATGAAFTNGAHKAYLKAAKTATSAKVFTFDKATAIKTIATATDAKIFDLTGREVKTPKAGIYVVNGVKKYIK